MTEQVRAIVTEEHPERKHLVYLDRIRVSFDGFALSIDAFGIQENALEVIMGGNGAGKTTMCDVISGRTRATWGRVFFKGEDITRATESRIAERGIGRKFQTPSVYDSLTVWENMELALPGRTGVWRSLWQGIEGWQEEQILGIVEMMDLHDELEKPARSLSHGKRQWLELAMLTLAGPDLLLVDEPAAGLTEEEVEKTAELLLELRSSHALIVIEHNLQLIRSLGSPIHYLDRGRIIAHGSYDEISSNPDVVEAYWGVRKQAC